MSEYFEDSDVDVDVEDADDDIADTNAATHVGAHTRPLDVLNNVIFLPHYIHYSPTQPDVLVFMKSDPKLS